MTKTIRRRVALFFFAFVSGLAALLAFRSLVVATVAALWAGLSAKALAGTAGVGKAALASQGSQDYLAALVGAFAGSLMLMLQLKGRPWPERLVLLTASIIAAYYGGLAADEAWTLGPGGVGVAGTVCAYLAVPVLDAVLALLHDIPWIKRLVWRRVTGENDPVASSGAAEEAGRADHR